ncbi:sodium-coupled neutral amino acid transporter 9 homolog isoform X1 [Macrosteles quadrilineatus]|uniref:sodium-coupled neutral amino acid transporter 9 homolog isoform X1 n=1 Tax=Macrosteles quadrilineatus TaxID=74068 RepID=UPI0023E1C290|nr:sodium-coupled neutral amino acid transporter 9 homolog isoform X1 [Macrosteles quadrilineatus]
MARARSKSEESQPLLSSDISRTNSYGGPPLRKISLNPPHEFDYFIRANTESLVSDQEGAPPILPDSNKQSSLVTIFVLWNTMVGTSLLTMPWGLERAGFAMGILLVMGMATLCCYTAHCVVSTQAAYGPPGGEISELTRHLLGRKAEILSKIFSYIVLAGALIVYWILMTNFLYFIVDFIYTEISGGFDQSTINGTVRCFPEAVATNVTISSEQTTFQKWWSLNLSVPIYLALLVGPLLSFKSVTFFTKFNSLGTLSLMYLMVFVMVKAFNSGWNLNLSDPSSPNYAKLFKTSFFATSGMLAMSYFLQNIVITIMRSNRNQKNNTRDLAIAYSLGMGTYLVIGILFYASFPLRKSCIADNLLNNFASWDVGTLVARVFLFFQLVTVYPLISFMLRYQVMTAFFAKPFPSRLHVIAFNAVVVIVCVLFAVFLPKIGTIIRFTGALSGFFHVFTLPCLLRLAGQKQAGKLSCFSLFLNLAIPLAGGINLIAQFFVSDS